MVNRRIVYTQQAQRDAKKLSASGMRPKAEAVLAILAEDPYRTPPPFEKLVGDLTGAYSRRAAPQPPPDPFELRPFPHAFGPDVQHSD